MNREPFYHESVKKMIVTFASIFDQINILNHHNRPIQVPLTYMQKEKFLEALMFDHTDNKQEIVFPRMAFELTSISYAAERHTNPLSKITNFNVKDKDGNEYVYNRIPYDFSFNLYVGARYQEDGLKIIEQILPFFTPELTLKIYEFTPFQIETNIPITLNSTSFQVDTEGPFSNRREILWTLDFTARSHLYSNIRTELTRIQNVIFDLSVDMDVVNKKFSMLIDPNADPKTVGIEFKGF